MIFHSYSCVSFSHSPPRRTQQTGQGPKGKNRLSVFCCIFEFDFLAFEFDLICHTYSYATTAFAAQGWTSLMHVCLILREQLCTKESCPQPTCIEKGPNELVLFLFRRAVQTHECWHSLSQDSNPTLRATQQKILEKIHSRTNVEHHT